MITGARARSGRTNDWRKKVAGNFFVWIGILTLLTLGVVQAVQGWDAIDQRHFTMDWQSSRHGGVTYRIVRDGLAAVLMGIGFLALGITLSGWAFGCAAGMARHYWPTLSPAFSRMFSSVSLGCFMVSLICIFPPWKLSSLPFWVVMGFTQSVFWSWRDFENKRLGATGIITIVVYRFDHPAGAGMLLGLIGSMAVWANICFLFPRLITGKDGV